MSDQVFHQLDAHECRPRSLRAAISLYTKDSAILWWECCSNKNLANGTTTLDQPRTHDKGNRLLEVGAGAGAVRVDRAGRMQELPPVEGAWDETFEIVWDAWSRIVEVKQGENAVGKYSYDGLTRRITRETGGELTHTYYSDTWRPLEDRVTDSATPTTPTVKAHYLWGARHRDDLVRRDRATTTPGTLNETRYVLMDYFSPAAITDEEGEVKERYAFSTFGLRSIFAPDFSPRTSSESDFEFSFQGQFEDSETGWINYGYRSYIPALGRWPSRDPIVELGGANLYQTSNGLVNSLDQLGLSEELECPAKCYNFTHGDIHRTYHPKDSFCRLLSISISDRKLVNRIADSAAENEAGELGVGKCSDLPSCCQKGDRVAGIAFTENKFPPIKISRCTFTLVVKNGKLDVFKVKKKE